MAMSILEFMFAYLSSEKIRDEVLTNEEKGLKPYVDATDAAVLVTLNERVIFDRIKAKSHLDEPAMQSVKQALAGVGLDLPTAYKIIRDGGADCHVPSSPKVMAWGAAAYGAGEVHLRKIVPREAKCNHLTTFELAGQGFTSGAQVQFVEQGGVGAIVAGTIVHRRADIDVHQYLRVTVTFPQRTTQTTWAVQMFDDHVLPGSWTQFSCTIAVAP